MSGFLGGNFEVFWGAILGLFGGPVSGFWGVIWGNLRFFGDQFWLVWGQFWLFFGRFVANCGVFWGTGSVFGVSQCHPHCPRCPQGVNTSPGPSWWTWSRGPWTQCGQGPLGRSSGLTTSSSVSHITFCPQLSPPGAPKSLQGPQSWDRGLQGGLRVPKSSLRSLKLA